MLDQCARMSENLFLSDAQEVLDVPPLSKEYG